VFARKKTFFIFIFSGSHFQQVSPVFDSHSLYQVPTSYITQEMPVADVEYAFEWDLKEKTRKSEVFVVEGNKFSIHLKIEDGGTDYSVFLHPVDLVQFPGLISYQFDLVSRQNNHIVQSSRGNGVFYKRTGGWGERGWIDPLNIRKHFLKVKVWNDKSLSDFVDRPVVDYSSQLFKRMFSNASFKVGGEVVYVLSGIVAERSAYFREMIEQKREPISLESQIPINGIDAFLFKMIIEWIYTFEIRGLNGLSPTLLDDLERLYIASRNYKVFDLCESIESYLKYLVNARNFGEIHQISKRIRSKSLQRAVFRAWISNSDEFNKNDDQITLTFPIDVLADTQIIPVSSDTQMIVKKEAVPIGITRVPILKAGVPIFFLIY
jgi:hypothetical protein